MFLKMGNISGALRDISGSLGLFGAEIIPKLKLKNFSSATN